MKIDVRVDFSNKLNKILQDYAKNNSIQMIIDKKNILIGKNDLDVTQDILDLFNKKVKEIKSK
jgi:Skp family chaperone for outer membrane proteins